MLATLTKIATAENRDLIIWKENGQIIYKDLLVNKTIALSGKDGSDFRITELGQDIIFVNDKKGNVSLFYQKADGEVQTYKLTVGKVQNIRGVNFLMATTYANLKKLPEQEISKNHDQLLLEQLFDWISLPMKHVSDLKMALNKFLKIVIEEVSAISGFMVLKEHDGFNLISIFGLTREEAQNIWLKMPKTLNQEILKSKIRVLLPENLKNKTSNKSTMYIRGIRAMVGFPIVAEGEVLGIYYIGFKNVFTDFSQPLQQILQTAGDLVGLVIQRATLREQLIATTLEKNTKNYLPEGRLMVGSSEALNQLYKVITRLAPVDVPTLIIGETGTGKELTACELHRLSGRSTKPFIAINAAALPQTLMESELFGHKKGAFSGAISDHVGLIEQAHGGTLFIDEIGELPLELQIKLLRVLQERVVVRLGDDKSRSVDFRLISATHQDLEDLVKQKKFREDLFYRIAGALIQIPPLRERRQDILELANFFKKRFVQRHNLENKEWSADARECLIASPWNGNIRELEHTVHRAVVMAENQVIHKADLQLNSLRSALIDDLAIPDDSAQSLAQAKDSWVKNYLIAALKRHAGKRNETAKFLGIGQRTLFRYLEQYDIRDL